MSQDHKQYDVIIVGAGIVGATIARELSRYRLRIAVLDKASDLPSGASRANSAMIHGGFDDKPGTVKASFCAAGNRRYHELHEQLDFQLVPCGSFVCAAGEQEHPHLELLLEQGRRNGVPGLEILSGDELRRREPHASGAITAALWSPSAAIVNNFEAVLAFLDNAQANGAELYLETLVSGLLKSPDGAEVLGVDIDEDASLEIGRRARGTPRVALRLLRRVRDVAAVSGSDRIRRAVACSALDMLGVDPEGLDDGDRKLLRAVVELFDGGPVGLSTLAAALNEDAQTIEDIYEPFLIQKGFLERTPRGRKATRGTFAYLGMEPTVRFRQLALLEEGE